MSGAVYSDVNTWGQLKELYDDDVQYQDHIQSSLWNFIRHADEDECQLDGKNWNIPVTFQLNESYGSINDDERLPDPDFGKGVFAQYSVKLSYAQIEATTFAATRGHRNGRPNGKWLDDTIKGTLLSFMSNLNFDAYANGRGYRATILTATGAASSFTATFTTRIRAGMKFDWYDSTLTTKRGTIKVAVKAIDRMNRTVYVDSSYGTGAVPSGATAGDVLVVSKALDPGEPTDGRYAAGLDRITDSSISIGGLSPSTYALWLPTNIAAGGANPNQEILQRFWDSMYEISGVYPDRMVFSPVWKRGYLNGFLNQRRFTSNSFDTGAASLSFSPVKMGQDEKKTKPVKFEMLEDKDCNPANVYVWNYSSFCIASDYSSEPHLADEDGAEFRIRPGYDSMSGYFRHWWNTIVKQRNAVGAMTGFAVATGAI
jgi:hypothetical protein